MLRKRSQAFLRKSFYEVGSFWKYKTKANSEQNTGFIESKQVDEPTWMEERLEDNPFLKLSSSLYYTDNEHDAAKLADMEDFSRTEVYNTNVNTSTYHHLNITPSHHLNII